MPSADFCSAVRPPLDGLSRRGDTKQISWGNLSRLPCTTAESTLRVLDGYGLRGKLAARPALAPCIRFVLSIGSHVCSTLPYMGTSMSRAKICRQAPLSFGRYYNVVSGTTSTSWQPHEALGKLRPSFRPSRTARMFRRSQPGATESPRLFHTPREPYNERNTTRGGARFQWLGHRCHTLTCGGPPTVDPNHDADIRIGSEAPKQRCPIFKSGLEAMEACGITATSDRYRQAASSSAEIFVHSKGLMSSSGRGATQLEVCRHLAGRDHAP